MPGTIANVRDAGDDVLSACGQAVRILRCQIRVDVEHLFEKRTEALDNLPIGALGTAADVVDLPCDPFLENQLDAAAMIPHMKPITAIRAISVDGQGTPMKRVNDRERDELL